MPFFSILVPSYNRPEYILDLINSILEQDFNDYEIIIADDCSPKQQIIKNYLNCLVDNRIKVYFHDVNLGEVANKNFLISKASGEYNMLIGDDDTFGTYEGKRFVSGSNDIVAAYFDFGDLEVSDAQFQTYWESIDGITDMFAEIA